MRTSDSANTANFRGGGKIRNILDLIGGVEGRATPGLNWRQDGLYCPAVTRSRRRCGRIGRRKKVWLVWHWHKTDTLWYSAH